VRRRKRTFTRARRARRDWVYRDDGAAHSVGGNVILTADDLGTYSPNSLAIGSTDQAGLILYDSRNYLRTMTHGGAGVLGAISPAGRAAGKRAQTHIVTGQIFIVTSDWAVNAEMGLAIRIGVFEQGVGSGLIETAANLSLWSSVGETSLAAFANQQRSNLWERRMRHAFAADTGAIFALPIRARVPARLDDNECLGIIFEVHQDSVNLTIFNYLRTLVSDEG